MFGCPTKATKRGDEFVESILKLKERGRERRRKGKRERKGRGKREKEKERERDVHTPTQRGSEERELV